jgi:hypothetical protein
MTEHPDLAMMVRAMSLYFERAYQQIYESIEILLGKLQGLRKLNLTGYSVYERENDAFQNNFLATGSMCSLSTVHLDIAEFTTEDLVKYIALPHLKRMFIHSFTETPSFSKIFHGRDYSNATLRKLTFRAHISLSSLNLLLTVFPNLLNHNPSHPRRPK